MERLKKFTGDALVDIKRKLIHRTKFIGQIGDVFVHGYQNSNFSLSDTQCVSRGIKDNPNIVSGIHGRLRYDYHLLMVSRGKMEKPQNATVEYLSKEEAVMKFTVPLSRKNSGKYGAYIFQYNACKREGRILKHDVEGDQVRLTFRPGRSSYGNEIRFWLFLSSADGTKRSDSIYVGQISPLCN